jgi:putative hydrolase of the HAD superfamily
MMAHIGTKTVFLDAGNTLISMNFDWVATELARAGLVTDAATLARAEARARPSISEHSASYPHDGGLPLFTRYLATIVGALPEARDLGLERVDAIVGTAAPRLKAPGGDHRLWSWVLPGVPDALERLADSGFALVVVSNSDGSVEQALGALGLMRHLRAVIDSELVGYEKPDRRIFDEALARVAARPESTVHVGDMYFQDVVGARAAGIDAVLLDPYGDWGDRDCSRRRNLSELAAQLVEGR